MQDDPRYEAINDNFVYSPITARAARQIAKALIKEFGKREDASAVRSKRMPFADRRGDFGYWTRGNGYRRVWICSKPHKGHHRGWGRLLHDVSHMVWRYRHPNWMPHGHGHAKLEFEIVSYARLRWFGVPLPQPAHTTTDLSDTQS